AGPAAARAHREPGSSRGAAAAPAAAVLPARESEAAAPLGAARPALARPVEFPRRPGCRRSLAQEVFRHAREARAIAADAPRRAEGDQHGDRASRTRRQPRRGARAAARAREAAAATPAFA